MPGLDLIVVGLALLIVGIRSVRRLAFFVIVLGAIVCGARIVRRRRESWT